MELIVLGSSSKGNGYILTNGSVSLIIEAGVKFDEVLKALNYDTSSIVGCIVTHEHGDHAGNIKEYVHNGVQVYTSKGTISKVGEMYGLNPIAENELFAISDFNIIPFKVQHDCVEPFGYFINHPETGRFCFITDAAYSPYKFNGLNNMIIECNYIDEVVYDMVKNDKLPSWRRDRLSNSHMSLERCEELIECNDISQVINIVLIHLSKDNCVYGTALDRIKSVSMKKVTIAKPGVRIDFNKTPF